MSRLAWAHAHETLLWAGKRGSRHTFDYDLINSRTPSARPSPVRSSRGGRNSTVTTQKFLRLVRRTILASTKEGDLVFDPFYAAKELGRFFVGAEREECAGIGAAVRSGVLREFPDLGSRDDSFGSTSGRARPHSLL